MSNQVKQVQISYALSKSDDRYMMDTKTFKVKKAGREDWSYLTIDLDTAKFELMKSFKTSVPTKLIHKDGNTNKLNLSQEFKDGITFAEVVQFAEQALEKADDGHPFFMGLSDLGFKNGFQQYKLQMEG